MGSREGPPGFWADTHTQANVPSALRPSASPSPCPRQASAPSRHMQPGKRMKCQLAAPLTLPARWMAATGGHRYSGVCGVWGDTDPLVTAGESQAERVMTLNPAPDRGIRSMRTGSPPFLGAHTGTARPGPGLWYWDLSTGRHLIWADPVLKAQLERGGV